MRTVARDHSGRWLSRALGLSLLVAPLGVRAQQAVITGRVSAAESNENLADSRVMIVNSSTVTQTNSEGRYTFRNVPTGTIEVRVHPRRVSGTEEIGDGRAGRVGDARLLDEGGGRPTPGSGDHGDGRPAQGRDRQRAVDDQRSAARRAERRVEHGRPPRRQGAGGDHGSAQHERLGSGHSNPRTELAQPEQRADHDRRRRAVLLELDQRRASGGRTRAS